MSTTNPGRTPEASKSATPERLVSLAHAGHRLGCSERTLRRMIAAGHLTGYRIGRRLVRVDLTEIDGLVRVIPTTRSRGPR